MESMTEIYAASLNLIRRERDYNKQRAIKRFFLIKDFETSFLPEYGKQFGPGSTYTKAVYAYCKLRGISIATFWRWLRAQKNHGIRGLVPKFGRRCSRDNEIKRRGSHKALRELKRRKNRLIASIAIDLRKPLQCLKTIQMIIERSKQIAPEVKERSLSILKFYSQGFFEGCKLSLRKPLTEEEIKVLRLYKARNHKKYSRKATAILMANEGCTLLETKKASNVTSSTIYRWLRLFNENRLDSIEVRVHAPVRDARKAERQTRIIDIVHKMPSFYGINRSTWTYAAIAAAYKQETCVAISTTMIQNTIKSTGYTWRHARKVLTSPDPGYKAKVELLLDALQGLKEGERFFFIDEVGPYKVKKYGGRVLAPKDQVETIPEFQKTRGKVQFVAALEAITNQMTWIFTADKSATALTSLFGKLVREYSEVPAIFFTWDSISVHSSKAVTGWISEHNEAGIGPHIEVVPLPSKSQFLNVIESVFGGMKKAVICNSDYANPQEMQEAVSRHFEERNQFYKDNPKRAGNKIWDKQAFDVDRLIGGLFKKM